MTTSTDPAGLGRMIRQQGLPERPQVIEQISEVRSDCFVGTIAVPAARTAFTLQAVIIQWRYRLTYTKSVQFHRFLTENEQFIAESCRKVMQGVHYQGTYMGLSGQRAAYTTLWGYDTWEAQGEWSKILNDKTSRFYQVVTDLRAYWTSDTDSMQEHFGVAAGIDLTKEGFLAITVDAEGKAPHKE